MTQLKSPELWLASSTSCSFAYSDSTSSRRKQCNAMHIANEPVCGFASCSNPLRLTLLSSSRRRRFTRSLSSSSAPSAALRLCSAHSFVSCVAFS